MVALLLGRFVVGPARKSSSPCLAHAAFLCGRSSVSLCARRFPATRFVEGRLRAWTNRLDPRASMPQRRGKASSYSRSCCTGPCRRCVAVGEDAPACLTVRVPPGRWTAARFFRARKACRFIRVHRLGVLSSGYDRGRCTCCPRGSFAQW